MSKFILSISQPPPIQQTLLGFASVDNYGSYENNKNFLGHGYAGFASWSESGCIRSVAQLLLGIEALRKTNDYFSFSLQNISYGMYNYSPIFHSSHTQKKDFKRSNFRYLSEIATSNYYGKKATLAAPTLQQYTFPIVLKNFLSV